MLSPALGWLREADLAFKKVDSLLRGNTFDEVDWLARHIPFTGLAFVPAFPAQHRTTEGGQPWWRNPAGSRAPMGVSIHDQLRARGWQVDTRPTPPDAHASHVAWVPDVLDDAALDTIARIALQTHPFWLWCGSAGLAHALARLLPARASSPATHAATHAATRAAPGPLMLVSASHHPISREQWRVLRAAHGRLCHVGEDPRSLQLDAAHYPTLIDLSAREPIAPQQAAALLHAQTQAIARHAPRPRALVVVGGDTLLALCQALGTTGLLSGVALQRPGWGCARMLGGRWDGLLCHTRSGSFGLPGDLLEVIDSL